MAHVRVPAWSVSSLVTQFGGEVVGDGASVVEWVAPIERPESGALMPFVSERYVRRAEALPSDSILLVARELLARPDVRALVARVRAAWVHPHPLWALSFVLDGASAPPPAQVAPTAILGEHVVIYPGVVIGERVRIEPLCVIGRPGFGWATGPRGELRAIPQLGGVVIEDDVSLGALSTVDAGTLSPTRVGRHSKLDAHCHVGHNTEIGEGVIVAAQTGFAGSVRVGRHSLIGGQVGVGDHVTIGERAKIAGGSGVIGDVADGATVAGYPAVERFRWLRGMAQLYTRTPRRGAP